MKRVGILVTQAATCGPPPGSVMNSSFSGQPVPVDKRFVLCYAPAAAHEAWDRSYYAVARAAEAVATIRDDLESFFWRFVVTPRVVPGVLALVAALAILGWWAVVSVGRWAESGWAMRYLPPLAGVVLLGIASSRLGRFRQRLSIWSGTCKAVVGEELAVVRKLLDDLPADPDAEEAADLVRRECPSPISEIAFFGQNFKAFTYMDFVLSPKLRHPSEQSELPQQHSLYRDAYYVGDVVYDNWRMFHKDRRTHSDPRFVGSGGRRGVI